MINFADTLTRRIGPLPVWGYGVGIGGAVLAAQYLRGRTGGDSGSTSPQSEDVDASTVTNTGDGGGISGGGNVVTEQVPGPPGEPGPQGEPGKSAPKAPAKPSCSEGMVPMYNPNRNVWEMRRVPKPRETKNTKYRWRGKPYCGWVKVTSSKVTKDRGAKGMGMPEASAASNSAPTIGSDDIGGFTIASPDTSPKPSVSRVRAIPIPMTPTIAGQRPRNLSRQVGRPFHGL